MRQMLQLGQVSWHTVVPRGLATLIAIRKGTMPLHRQVDAINELAPLKATQGQLCESIMNKTGSNSCSVWQVFAYDSNETVC